jgi:hypothetical protein
MDEPETPDVFMPAMARDSKKAMLLQVEDNSPEIHMP